MFKIFAVLLLGLAPLTLAQDYRARVQGVVTDTSHAVVPGARVKLLNIRTGVSVARETTATGEYLFDLVEPGSYSLACERDGFTRFVQENFTVQVRDDITVNVMLRPGQVNNSVTVDAAPPAVEFNSSSVQLMVDRTMLDELPQINRNPFVLATLDPSVVNRSTFAPDQRYPFYMFASSLLDIGGATQGRNELLLDGAPLMMGDRGSYSPPMDAVQEMTVQENSVDAQYGRTAGGVMSVAMKSGTNEFHGTAYYFGRNPDLNARINAVANTPSRTHNNIFGGTLGNPIKKNKFFNFSAFEAWSTTEFTQQVLRTFPTSLQRTGNFSQTLNNKGAESIIYDPWTSVLNVAANTGSRMPFPGNIIPASRIDPTAARVMQDVPAPNGPGIDVTGTDNFEAGLFTHHSYWNFSDRMDWNPNDKWRIYGRFSRFQDTNAPNYYADTPGLGIDGGIMNSTNITTDAVYTISPNTFINLRWSSVFIEDDLRDPNSELPSNGLSEFWPGNPWYQPYLKDVPHIFYPDFTIHGRLAGSAYWEHGSSHYASVDMAHHQGKHFLKFGADFTRFAEYNYNPTGLSLDAADAALTANTFISPNTGVSGNNYASFLLGGISSGSDSYTVPQDQRVNAFGMFIQDDYKITRRLTLNLGLRWEYETPPETLNNIYTRYLDLTNPIPEMQQNPPQIPSSVTKYANIDYQWNGALVFSNNSHPGLWNNNPHEFMPRLGAAFAINNKTALRFGYGRYINPPMNVIAGPQQMLLGPAYGYSIASTVIAPLNGIPQAMLSNPFPSTNPLEPVPGQSLGRYTQLGDSVTWDDQTMQTSVSDRYTLSLQRSLPWNLVADATYFMLLAHDLPYAKDMNMADPELSVVDKAALAQTVANPFYNYLTPSLFPGPLRNQKTVPISTLLVPYPQYGTLTQDNTPGFKSHTYSAELRLRRSFRHGLGFTLSYANPVTHTQAFFNPEDQYLNHPTYQATALPEHSLNASGTWELPMGQGRTYLSHAPKAADLLLGGWSFSPLATFNSGTPILFGALAVLKPGSPKFGDPALGQWFDTSFFAKQTAYSIRSNPEFYTGLNGPMNWNIDATLSKYFRIHEHYRLEVRMEAYNMLNEIMRGMPNVTVTSALFGRVTTQANQGRQFQYTLRIHF